MGSLTQTPWGHKDRWYWIWIKNSYVRCGWKFSV